MFSALSGFALVFAALFATGCAAVNDLYENAFAGGAFFENIFPKKKARVYEYYPSCGKSFEELREGGKDLKRGAFMIRVLGPVIFSEEQIAKDPRLSEENQYGTFLKNGKTNWDYLIPESDGDFSGAPVDFLVSPKVQGEPYDERLGYYKRARDFGGEIGQVSLDLLGDANRCFKRSLELLEEDRALGTADPAETAARLGEIGAGFREVKALTAEFGSTEGRNAPVYERVLELERDRTEDRIPDGFMRDVEGIPATVRARVGNYLMLSIFVDDNIRALEAFERNLAPEAAPAVSVP
jgi:hypothetical protein